MPIDPVNESSIDLAAAAIAAGPGCPTCTARVALGSPHVIVGRAGVRVYCSADCLAMASRPKLEPQPRGPLLRAPKPAEAIFVLGVGLASLSPCAAPRDVELFRPAIAEARTAIEAPRPHLGPPAPTEDERAAEFAVAATADTWIHPLAGPTRRMPLRASRAFGAERGGDRPLECRSGHCGVDIGTTWGEPVLVVHDGVVDRVNRDPRRSGGKYVWISHRGGTVKTHYFHLAAIPRTLREGRKVVTGQVLGVLGDTGIDHSEAHLHFTVSVQPTPDSKQVYIDPEPLIALWPLKGGDAIAALAPPGVPVGAVGRRRGHRVRHDSRAESRKVARRARRARRAESMRREARADDLGPQTESADGELETIERAAPPVDSVSTGRETAPAPRPLPSARLGADGAAAIAPATHPLQPSL